MVLTRQHRAAVPARLLSRSSPVAILAVVLALVAAACGTSSNDASRYGGRVYRHDRGTIPDDSPPPTEVSRAYPLTYNPTPCWFPSASANGLQADCGQLTVPADRTKPGGATVKLAVARIHSQSPTPKADPVVYLEGGPGGSAISGVDYWTKPAANFLADRDLILIDQRGTGFSEPRITCDKLTDSYTGDVTVLTEECLRIIRNQGVNVADFNTTESADDVDDVRAALKITTWNLFGISYGTRLALWTMHRHPEGVRSVVIDSVYPPGVKGLAEIPLDLQRSVQAIDADCAAQPTCAAAYPDLLGQLVSGVEKLDAPSGATGMSSRGGRYLNELFHVLYQYDTMPDIPKAISLLNHDDLNGSLDLLEGKNVAIRHPEKKDEQPPPGARTRPHMTEGLFHSVECAESVPSTTPDDLRAAGKTMAAPLSAPFVESGLQQIALCNVWGVPRDDLADVHSDIPTLVMAGSYDPITPPAWAQRAQSFLTRSRFQLVIGSGHGTWTAGDCPKQEITAFFDDPAAPGPDCTGAPPEFTL